MPPAGLEVVGTVTAWYAHQQAAAIKLSAPIRVGDAIYIRGFTTDFRHDVASIQYQHRAVTEGKAGQVVGVAMPSRCRQRDGVYRLSP